MMEHNIMCLYSLQHAPKLHMLSHGEPLACSLLPGNGVKGEKPVIFAYLLPNESRRAKEYKLIIKMTL